MHYTSPGKFGLLTVGFGYRHPDCRVSSLQLHCGDSCQLVKSSIVSVLCNETLARPTPQLSALLHFLLLPRLLFCQSFCIPHVDFPSPVPFSLCSCSSASLRGTLHLGSVSLSLLGMFRCGLLPLFVWCLLHSPQICSIHLDNTEAWSMLLLSFLPTKITFSHQSVCLR